MVPVSRQVLIERLPRLGFEGPFMGGSHQFMLGRGRKLIGPNPHQGVIGVGLLARILRQAGVTLQEWDRL